MGVIILANTNKSSVNLRAAAYNTPLAGPDAAPVQASAAGRRRAPGALLSGTAFNAQISVILDGNCSLLGVPLRN